jgi:hypothetical protein
VSGDNLNPEAFEELFPDFPKDVELPKVERVLEKSYAPGVRQVVAGYKVGETKFEQFTNDASLVRSARPLFPNMPPSLQANLSDFYEPDKSSAWRLYDQHRNLVQSSGKNVDQITCVVGDADGAIVTLTFDHGTLSKMEPVK